MKRKRFDGTLQAEDECQLPPSITHNSILPGPPSSAFLCAILDRLRSLSAPEELDSTLFPEDGLDAREEVPKTERRQERRASRRRRRTAPGSPLAHDLSGAAPQVSFRHPEKDSASRLRGDAVTETKGVRREDENAEGSEVLSTALEGVYPSPLSRSSSLLALDENPAPITMETSTSPLRSGRAKLDSTLVAQGCPAFSRIPSAFAAAKEKSVLGGALAFFAEVLCTLLLAGPEKGAGIPKEWAGYVASQKELTPAYLYELQGLTTLLFFVWTQVTSMDCRYTWLWEKMKHYREEEKKCTHPQHSGSDGGKPSLPPSPSSDFGSANGDHVHVETAKKSGNGNTGGGSSDGVGVGGNDVKANAVAFLSSLGSKKDVEEALHVEEKETSRSLSSPSCSSLFSSSVQISKAAEKNASSGNSSQSSHTLVDPPHDKVQAGVMASGDTTTTTATTVNAVLSTHNGTVSEMKQTVWTPERVPSASKTKHDTTTRSAMKEGDHTIASEASLSGPRGDTPLPMPSRSKPQPMPNTRKRDAEVMSENHSPVSSLPPLHTLQPGRGTSFNPSRSTEIVARCDGSEPEYLSSSPAGRETDAKKDNGGGENRKVTEEKPPRRFVHVSKPDRRTQEKVNRPPASSREQNHHPNDSIDAAHAPSSTLSGGEERSLPNRSSASPLRSDPAVGSPFVVRPSSSSLPRQKNRSEQKRFTFLSEDPSASPLSMHSKDASSSAIPTPAKAHEMHSSLRYSAHPFLHANGDKHDSVHSMVAASSLSSLPALLPLSSSPPSPLPLASSWTRLHTVCGTKIEAPPGLPKTFSLLPSTPPVTVLVGKAEHTNAMVQSKAENGNEREDVGGASTEMLRLPVTTSDVPVWTVFSYRSKAHEKGERPGDVSRTAAIHGGVVEKMHPKDGERNGDGGVFFYPSSSLQDHQEAQDSRAKAVLQMFLPHPSPYASCSPRKRRGHPSREALTEDGTVQKTTSLPDPNATTSNLVQSKATREESTLPCGEENEKRLGKRTDEKKEAFSSGMVQVCGKHIGSSEEERLPSTATKGSSAPGEERWHTRKENSDEKGKKKKNRRSGVQLEPEAVRVLPPALLQAAATAAILVSMDAREEGIQRKQRQNSGDNHTNVPPPLEEVLQVLPAPSAPGRLSCATSSRSPVTKHDPSRQEEEESKRINERYALEEPRVDPSSASKFSHFLSQLKDAEALGALLAPSAKTCPTSMPTTAFSRPSPLSGIPFPASAAKKKSDFSSPDLPSTLTAMTKQGHSTSVLPLLSHPPQELLSSVCAHLAAVAAAGTMATHEKGLHPSGSSPLRSGRSSPVGVVPSFRTTVEKVMQRSSEEDLKKKLGVSRISNFADQRDIADFFTGLEDLEALFDEL